MNLKEIYCNDYLGDSFEVKYAVKIEYDASKLDFDLLTIWLTDSIGKCAKPIKAYYISAMGNSGVRSFAENIYVSRL